LAAEGLCTGQPHPSRVSSPAQLLPLLSVDVKFVSRCAAVALLLPVVVAATSVDPFGWLEPPLTIDATTRSHLDQGEVVARVLPAVDGEIGIFAAVRLSASAETLPAWANAIAQLKRSPYVLKVRRFSDRPAIEDLNDLTLDDVDLAAIRECKPGNCDVKLPREDIVALRQAALAAGPRWKEVVQNEFRRIVLAHLVAYQSGGFLSLPPYEDRRKPIDRHSVYRLLVERSPYRAGVMASDPGESFFYWSKEQYGAGKPVISVTHVDIVWFGGISALRVAVISREILATHYRNGSVGFTAVTEDDAGQRYLVYVNRSQLDVLGGIFGGWKRGIVEGKLRSESVEALNMVRLRLESGLPLE
jgi:hypothetical protein